MTREQAVRFLVLHPVKFMHMLGFTKMGDLHNQWMRDMITGKGDEALQSHRGSYKTTCVSGALSIIPVVAPNDRTLFQRKTDDDVKEVMSQVRAILLSPQMMYFVRCIYDANIRLTTDNAFEIRTNLTTDRRGTPQLLAMGIGGSLTGKHFDRIFTDDIINIIDRISKAERERTKLIYQELQNIKNRNGRIFNTLTPWHPESAESLMPNIQRYDCYETKLITPEELEEIKEKMIPSLFACNYELKHISSDDIIFLYPNVDADPALAKQGFGHIDAAYGGEDYTAFTICSKRNGCYYVFGKLWQRAVDEVEDEIIFLRQQFLCGKIYTEDNADKGYLAKDLRKKGERVSTYTEHWNKYIKITTFLKRVWKDVYFVRGTDAEYINQICDYNEDAEHDDAPDSLASLIRQMKNKETEAGGYKSIFGGVY